MNLANYLIEQEGKNWAELLSDWSPPLPETFTVWMVNRFGDVFAVFEDESVNVLALDSGNVTRLADDREHFCQLIDEGNNANDWLSIPVVDRCVAAGMRLGSDQCYWYKIPPVLGGKYVVENIAAISLRECYSFVADIHAQIRDMPDGTKVRLLVKTG